MNKRFPLISSKDDDSRGYCRWQQPSMQSYMLSCCDCGLVHEFKFRVVYRKKDVKKKRPVVKFKCRRARNYTAQQRKIRGIRIRIKNG